MSQQAQLDPLRFKPKYQKHYPDLIIELFKQGKSIAGFCAEAKISKSTFTDWLEVHPEFKEAYGVAKSYGEQYMEDMAMRSMEEGTPINNGLFNFLMVNRFGYTNQRRLKLDKLGLNAETNIEVIKAAIYDADGATVSEAKDLVGVVKDLAAIDESVNQAKRIDALEESVHGKAIQGS